MGATCISFSSAASLQLHPLSYNKLLFDTCPFLHPATDPLFICHAYCLQLRPRRPEWHRPWRWRWIRTRIGKKVRSIVDGECNEEDWSAAILYLLILRPCISHVFSASFISKKIRLKFLLGWVCALGFNPSPLSDTHSPRLENNLLSTTMSSMITTQLFISAVSYSLIQIKELSDF